jgi:hypothetical protein
MTHYLSSMPLWAIILFIISFFWSLVFISGRVKQAAIDAGMSAGRSRNIQFGVVGFYTAYLVYVSVLALNGILDSKSIPPTVMLYAALPLTFTLFGLIGNTKLFKKLLQSITLESLITLHIFRILGVFFILLYGYRLLPAEFAFSAGMGDIITAILAWPVAKMVSKRSTWSIPAVYAWNILGIFDIVNLLIIATIIGKNSIGTSAPGIREMTLFPFSWFPAFAPPTILFLHTAVFRKLHQLKTK